MIGTHSIPPGDEPKPGDVFTDRYGLPWFLIERNGGLKLVNVNGNWDTFEGIDAAYGPLTSVYPATDRVPAPKRALAKALGIGGDMSWAGLIGIAKSQRAGLNGYREAAEHAGRRVNQLQAMLPSVDAIVLRRPTYEATRNLEQALEGLMSELIEASDGDVVLRHADDHTEMNAQDALTLAAHIALAAADAGAQQDGGGRRD